jgi:hypothetical protein
MTNFVYVLHGKGGSPEGSAKTIANLLPARSVPTFRPTLLHTDPTVSAEASYELCTFMPDSLVIGISLGGLLAAKFQEDFPGHNLKVITLVSPTRADNLSLTPGKRPNLIALYSTQDPVIGTRANWEDFTDNAFNVPWMKSHNIDDQKYSIGLFLTEFMQGREPREIIEDLHRFPAF